MTKRSIIKIDEKKCNGCGLCIPNCPEGALKVIDGKVRLISDLFCDGLGACIGHCPEGAISIEEREAEKYDEKKVMTNIIPQGENVIKEHLKHLKDHNEKNYLKEAIDCLNEQGIENPLKEEQETKPLPCGCPGTALRKIKVEESEDEIEIGKQKSQLRQWPVQLNLLPPFASFFNDSDLLVCADCVPFAHANFHSDLLKGKSLVIGCPKLDDVQSYEEKLTEIFKNNNIKSVTVAIMEVPCCYSLYSSVESAINKSGKKIPLIKEVIGIDGNKNH
jgi:ferredoxin